MSIMTAWRGGSQHNWRFVRVGGFDQVRLDMPADLLALEQLDQKLWVALACPTRGLEFDNKTLDLIDADGDGRIRAPDIIAAVKWACGSLKDPADLLKGAPELPLVAINDATPEGRQLLASARQVLVNLGQAQASAISAADTADTTRIFAQTRFNGDGIVPAEAADDPAVAAVIADIIACLGPDIDRSGKPGVNQAKLDQFLADAQGYSDWWKKAEGDAAAVLPCGEGTSAAAEALAAVKAKVDDYFARCRLAAFDARALLALNRQESEFLALAAKDLTITSAEIAGFPLAKIEAGRPLPLTGAVNPAWGDRLSVLAARVVTPLLGERQVLTEADWAAVTGRFAAYEAWQGAKAGAAVEKLGLARVREILAGPARTAITAFIAKDKALEPEASAIAAVDKLVRYHRDLYKLLNNFVCFRDFYGRKDKAVFQAGRLYLDQRSCDLCVRVEDMARHGAMAHMSYAYLAYCDLVRKSTGEKMTIAAAFTAGDADNLMVGRNGLFYDRQGRDWDATIVKIVDNPISIRQAFWAPYKRVLRAIEAQIAKRAAAADAAADQHMTSAVTDATAASNAQAAAKTAGSRKIDVGTVAALGVALGSIGTFLGILLGKFIDLGIWMPIGLVLLMLLISGPSMLIAAMKLRQRNLGPILDANGWAVNAKARINIPFGGSLTATASLPPGSHRDLIDPYADRKRGRNWTIIIVVLAVVLWAAWFFGALEWAVPGFFPQSSWVRARQQQNAPPPTTQPATQPAR